MSGTAAILVNWRQPKFTVDAIAALTRQTICPAIFVVDNGSGDDSVSKLLEAKNRYHFNLIELSENLGFGAGCNAGMARAAELGFDNIWLINNDAVADPDCLEKMLARMHEGPWPMIVGSNIRGRLSEGLGHSGGAMSAWTLTCRSLMSEADYSGKAFAWITGASMLFPIRLYQESGGFKKCFFMYWEDADLVMRARKNGYHLGVAEQAVVRHDAGTSSEGMSVQRYRWHLESQRYFLSQHHPHPSIAKAILFTRYILKSLLDCDLDRLRMIFNCVFNIKENYNG